MTKSETLQAAEIMKRAAEGEMVELTRRDYLQWRIEPGHPGFNWVAFDYRILDFPSPPPNQKWHNPANLNATQVGVHEGWRLGLEGGGICEEMWLDGKWVPFEIGKVIGKGFPITFRTKSPLPEVKADPKKLAW